MVRLVFDRKAFQPGRSIDRQEGMVALRPGALGRGLGQGGVAFCFPNPMPPSGCIVIVETDGRFLMTNWGVLALIQVEV